MPAGPAEILAKYFTDIGTADFQVRLGPDEWPITVDKMPTDLDKCITCWDAGGRLERAEMRRGTNKAWKRVGITVRGLEASEVVDKCDEITAVCRAVGVPLDNGGNGSFVQVSARGGNFAMSSVRPETVPIYVGEEPETQRVLYSVNVLMSYIRTA